MKKSLAMIVGTVLLSALLAPAQDTPKGRVVESGTISATYQREAAPAQPAGVTNSVKAQANCPVMGGAINKKLFVEQDGVRIYVCCGGCIEPLKKDFAAQRAKLEKQGVVLEAAQPAADKKP